MRQRPTFDPAQHHRRSVRLRGYDYREAGAYFVSIVAQDRLCLLSEVTNGATVPTAAGRMVADAWPALPNRFPLVSLDAFVLMPNHIHGIVVLTEPEAGSGVADGASETGATTRVAPTGEERDRERPTEPPPKDDPPVGATLVVAHDEGGAASPEPAGTATRPRLGDVVGAFKSLTTLAYPRGVRTSGWPPFAGRLWQRSYHEHVIRNERTLDLIRECITNKPLQWELDEENPAATRQPNRTACPNTISHTPTGWSPGVAPPR